MLSINDGFYDERREPSGIAEVLLAEGEYESSTENILKGFKIFQKKYVYKNVILQMAIIILGLISQIFAIMSSEKGSDVSFSYFVIIMCILLGIYIVSRPHNTYKKLEKSLGEIEGTVYKSEIYTNKIIVSTIYDTYINKEQDEASEEQKDEAEQSEEEKLPPATVIHLDNGAVDIVESSDMYVVYVKRVNVFVIPKSAFSDDENTLIKEKLSSIMGIRYKEN